jgi:hypothetical protein
MSASTRPDIVARRPEDVLSIVPYLLGFHPRESLVLVALGRPRQRVVCAMRIDLPAPESASAVTEQLLPALRNCAATRVFVIAYSDTDQPARSVAAAVARLLAAAQLGVAAIWRSDGSRWWCCCESDPPCDPAEGTPYDGSDSPCPAEAVLNGMVALPDRAALERLVAAPPEPQRTAMARLTQRMAADLQGPRRAARALPSLVVRGQREVEQLVRAFVAQPRPLVDAEVARLCAWLRHVHVRDAAWCLLDRARLDAHLDLWQQVTSRAAPGYVAAPAALLAFAAWLAGRGALAQCALDRCFADEPDYSLGRLLAEALAAGLPPSTWQPVPLSELYAATRGARSAVLP